jgi:hypothetical protein
VRGCLLAQLAGCTRVSKIARAADAASKACDDGVGELSNRDGEMFEESRAPSTSEERLPVIAAEE